MYRRYEPTPGQNRPQQSQQNKRPCPPPRPPRSGPSSADKKQESPKPKPPEKHPHPLTKLIPQSLYNPETGKVLGMLSAEDLLIVALILLLIDGGDEASDNSFLIYALLYILLSDHIDLPF